MRRFYDTAIGLVLFFAWCAAAGAHETDQYSVPSGRAYADLRFEFSRELYDVLATTVQRINARIELTLEDGAPTSSTLRYQRQDHLAREVWAAFPLRVMYVEFNEAWLRTPEIRERYPGLLTIYGPPTWIYSHWALVIDPTKLPRQVRCSTIMVGGVHFGTDKLMHFVHLGHAYYQAYARARSAGADEATAMRQAVRVGTGSHPIFSEETWLGLVSTGVRSNADLAVNYTGLKFFRNLTEPIAFKGEIQPPLLVRDGEFWRLNDHVRRDRDIFSIYVSEHWDEALLPNTYAPGVAACVADEVEQRCAAVVDWYRDERGQVRGVEDFRELNVALSTYYGEAYGYKGAFDQVVGIANCCFGGDTSAPAPPVVGSAAHQGAGLGNGLADADDSEASGGPDAFGRSALWWAARRGNGDRVAALLAGGGDVGVADIDGETPLHAAVRGGNLEAVRALLASHAPVDAASRLGVRALHLAIRLDRGDLVEVLLDAGAEVNVTDAFGCTPLHDAADRGADAIAARLRACGADPEAVDHFGRKAGSMAVPPQAVMGVEP